MSDKSLNFHNDGKFYIHGKFDDSISTEIIPMLIKEIKKKENIRGATIEIHISSYGGEVRKLQELLGWVEYAKSKGITIETYALSCAYSCGSMLACAGTQGHRYISENSDNLLHLGSISGAMETDLQAERIMRRAEKHFDFVRRLYKKYAKVKNLNAVIKDDNYLLYGQEIIDNGLADKFL